MERETLYAITRQGFTMTLLDRYAEAIEVFDKVIDQSPKYLLARKGSTLGLNYGLLMHWFTGKAEAHFYVALRQVGRYQDQLAVSHAQKSLTVSARLSFSQILRPRSDRLLPSTSWNSPSLGISWCTVFASRLRLSVEEIRRCLHASPSAQWHDHTHSIATVDEKVRRKSNQGCGRMYQVEKNGSTSTCREVSRRDPRVIPDSCCSFD